MKTLTNFLLDDTFHEQQQKNLGKFIPDIPGVTDFQTGHVPQLSDNLFFQNKEIYISKHSRYAPYPEHSHLFLEVNYMFQGSCQQVINGELLTLNQGDILLMDIGSVHSINTLQQQDILCNVLFQNNHVSLEWLNQLKGKNSLLYQSLLNQNHHQNDGGKYLLIKAGSKANNISYLMERLLSEYFLPQDFSEAMISNFLPILLYEIARNIPEIIEENFDNSNPYLKILKLIDTQYQTITLSEASKQLNFNKNYLSNLVKDKSGHTFTELINQKKLQKAQLLIQSTRLPINEICNQVGFTNRTYFYKAYKKYFNHSPSSDR